MFITIDNSHSNFLFCLIFTQPSWYLNLVQCLLKKMGKLFEQEWHSAENKTEIIQHVIKIQ